MSVPRQLPLGVRLRDSSVFASFHAGSNGLVVETLRTLHPEPHRPSIWLFGPGGTGKTHLLQAVCARAGETGQSAAYLPLGEMHTLGPTVLAGCGRLNWVCLDDVAMLAGDAVWERALFALYTELWDSGGRLIVTASSPPARVPFQLQDLASRFGGGTVLRLQPLEEGERLEALRLHASQRGLELPDETASFLLNRLPRDMHSLCAFLDTLDEAALVAQRRLTVPFVSAFLKSAAGE
ncbi:MAG: DnaA regulatory inactivator Hda [Steroidobacteraceae bacterium]